MRGRDKTSRLEGGGEEKIEECSKKVTSTETKYQCVSGVATVTALKAYNQGRCTSRP